MKKILLVIYLLSFNSFSNNTKLVKKDLIYAHIQLNEVEVLKHGLTLDDFIDTLAYKESRHNWRVVNRYGYMGLYQLGDALLVDISKTTTDSSLKGIHHRVNSKLFKNNPNIFPPMLQRQVLIESLKLRKHRLRNYSHYIGCEINGIKITESGLIAGSHLVGTGNVRKYLSSGGKIDKADGNGVLCSSYIEFFNGYNLSI